MPATEIALRHVGRPVPNVPLLGGFAAMSGLIRLDSVIKAINDKFSGKVAAGNVAAATEAFNIVREEIAADGQAREGQRGAFSNVGSNSHA